VNCKGNGLLRIFARPLEGYPYRVKATCAKGGFFNHKFAYLRSSQLKNIHMAKTIAQLEKEIKQLKSENTGLEARLFNTGVELARTEQHLRSAEKALIEKDAIIESKTELCDALQQKYELRNPLCVITDILSGLQVPEQVNAVMNIAHSTLDTYRKEQAKAVQTAKFFQNNTAQLQSYLSRCVSGDITTLP
jgi:septal ring factor EnvC (AmiA/AmiB activator)